MARKAAAATAEPAVTSPFPARKARKDRKFDEKREAVLSVAAKLFTDKGFENTSLNDIANALNITKPTIYYYFSNKNEILLTIKRQAQTQLYEAIEDANKVEGTGLEKLLALLPRYIAVMASDYGKCLIKIAPRVLNESGRDEIEGRNAISIERTMSFIQQGMDDGSIIARPLRITYNAVFGMLNAIARWYNPAGAIRLPQLIEDYTEILRAALTRDVR